MKTRSLFGRKYLDIETRELEMTPGPRDVVVKVLACGVCGTDLNFLRDYDGDFMPLGHEIAGEVVLCGSGVKGISPGDSVTVEDCSMCGDCPDCKDGHAEFCRNMHTLNGYPGMGEYVMVDFGNLNVYSGLDPVHACLTEPLAVALAAVNKADIPLNGSVMVFGAGPIGLLTAALARKRGAGFVGISARSSASPMNKARLALAEKIGCDLVVVTKEQDLIGEVKKLYPRGVDRVIVTSPPASAREAFRIIRFGGAISLLGLSFKGDHVIPLDVNAAIFNKTSINTVFAEPAVGFAAATELIRRGVIDASLFQTHTFDFAAACETLAGCLDGTLPVIKSVFTPFA